MASESRRDRPLRTCYPCRRRKVRCDKRRPSCSQCEKGKLTCAYDGARPQRVDFQFIAEAPGGTASTLGQSESTLGNLGYNEQSPTRSRGHLSEQPGRRLRYVESSYWAYDPNDEETIDTLVGEQTRFEILDPLESLEKDPFGSGTQQTSATVSEQGSSISGNTASNNFAGIRTTIPYRVMGDLASPPPSVRNTSRYQRHASIAFLGSLPPKPLCDRLVDFYIAGYHPIVPVIHVPTFKIEYESFWKARLKDAAPMQGTSHFICLLLAVVFAGAVVCPNIDLLRDVLPKQPRSREELESDLHELASKALRKASFPRTPSLETFSAYMVIQITWMRVEEPLTTCAFVGLAYRVAQMLGLHRDPSHFSSLQPVVAEVRRRLWWQLVHTDVAVGHAAGLPPMIDISLCDVRQVSELKEELIGTREGLEYEARLGKASSSASPTYFSTCSILLRGKFQMTALIKDVLGLIYGQNAITYQDLIQLRIKIRTVTDELKTRIKRIPFTPRRTPQDLPFHSRVPQEALESNLDSWARLYLSIMIDRVWIFASHPVLKNSVNEIWHEIQPQALEYCRDYLRKVAQISCFEEFQYFHWCWPGIYQPLLALMTLLTELRRNPRSPASASFREVIDIIFALCGPGGGLVAVVNDVMRSRPLNEGGSESWDLLWNFRSRAWRAAGLDPHVLWTREQALETIYKDYDQSQLDYIRPSPPFTTQVPERSESIDHIAVTPGALSHHFGSGPLNPVPMANVDQSFWDQMMDEHNQMDMDLANYEDFNLDLDLDHNTS